jgi:hypothetical protein
MKSNNFLKIAVFGISMLLMSCTDSVMNELTNSNNDSAARRGAGDGVRVNPSTLPAAIITYINTNYPGTTITKAEKYATKYEVTLSNLVKLEFKLDGTFIEVSGGGGNGGGGNDDGDHIDPASLPAAIKTYISTNYPSTTITKAEKSATEYEVRLSNGVKLEFNLDGTFKEISGGRRGADDGTQIDPATLPMAIKTYISTNYPTATITKAEKSATEYEVTLSNALKLEFRLDGTFKEISGGSGKSGRR